MTVRNRKGNLFIVSAPSGAGKTTLCQKLTSVVPNIRHSVSYTTRSPRRGEVDGRDYRFVSEDAFRKMAKKGDFAEWAEVHGNLYGTARKSLDELREAGTDVILDIDTQGAAKIRKHYDDGVFIFILPPSLEDLRGRLENRKSNSTDDIELRMKRARDEIKDYKSYDYVIINAHFDEALEELKAIVLAEGRRTKAINPRWVKETFRI
jgi:guanylate kinase